MNEQNQSFDQDIEQLLVKLSTNDNLVMVEDLFEVYITPEFAGHDFFNLMGRLTQLLGNEAGLLLMFLQRPNIQLNAAGIHKPAINRLLRIRNLYGQIINNAQVSISRPFGFKGLAIGSEHGKEQFYYHIQRRDGENFSFECIFNESLQISIQMISNLSDRMQTGNNAIDLLLVNEFRRAVDQLSGSFEDLEKTVVENE